MTTLDIIILIPLGYGLVRGFFHGFFKEMASLVSVVLGMVAARLLGGDLGEYFVAHFAWTEQVAQAVAYFTLFLGVALLLNLLAWLLAKLFSAASLGWINKLAGAVFGMLKFAIVVSILLNCFASVNDFTKWFDNETLQKSALYEPLKNIAPAAWTGVQQIGAQKSEN